MSDTILLAIEDGVATVTMNRPDKLNAINYPFLKEFTERVREATLHPDVGCIVVTGAGRGFCAGGDLKEGANPPKDLPAGEKALTLRDGSEGCRLLRECGIPTIAMVNGPVAGAGIGIAGACDLRFAAKSATFLSAFDRIGGGGDYSSTYVWTRALGAAKVRELFLLGEKFTADEALAFGLYTKVFEDADLKDATYAQARKFANGPRPGWGYMKQNLNNAENALFAEHLDREATNMRKSTAESFAYLKARKEAAATKG